MNETRDYLFHLARRAKDYEQIRRRVLKYIIHNKIEDSEIATDLFIMGFLWKANKRNETLKEIDIAMLLGADEDDELNFETDPIDSYILDSEQTEMEFEELLDKVVSNYN